MRIGPIAPPRVEEIETFWSDIPDALSPRCVYQLRRIAEGWRPNGRINRMGYYDSSSWYGVWIWEYLHVISRAVQGSEGGATNPNHVALRNALLVSAGLDPMPAVWTRWHVDRKVVPESMLT